MKSILERFLPLLVATLLSIACFANIALAEKNAVEEA